MGRERSDKRRRRERDGDDDRYRKRKRDDGDRSWKKISSKVGFLDLLASRATDFSNSQGARLLIKMATSGVISLSALGMLGIMGAFKVLSVPLAFGTVCVSMLAMGAIWYSSRKETVESGSEEQKQMADQLDAMQSKLALLEERLANVEVIESFEDRLAAKTLSAGVIVKSASAEHSVSTSPAIGPGMME